MAARPTGDGLGRLFVVAAATALAFLIANGLWMADQDADNWQALAVTRSPYEMDVQAAVYEKLLKLERALGPTGVVSTSSRRPARLLHRLPDGRRPGLQRTPHRAPGARHPAGPRHLHELRPRPRQVGLPVRHPALPPRRPAAALGHRRAPGLAHFPGLPPRTRRRLPGSSSVPLPRRALPPSPSMRRAPPSPSRRAPSPLRPRWPTAPRHPVRPAQRRAGAPALR